MQPQPMRLAKRLHHHATFALRHLAEGHIEAAERYLRDQGLLGDSTITPVVATIIGWGLTKGLIGREPPPRLDDSLAMLSKHGLLINHREKHYAGRTLLHRAIRPSDEPIGVKFPADAGNEIAPLAPIEWRDDR